MDYAAQKAADLFRWQRHLNFANAPYGHRKWEAASCMAYGPHTNNLTIIVDAGYCLDAINKED